MTLPPHCAILLLLLLLPSRAQAEPTLDWNAPSGCPDAATVEHAVKHASGESAWQSPLDVEAEVERIATGYALTLVVRTSTGESRERILASDCSLFVRLIAVKVSLLVTEAEPTRPAAYGGSAWSVRVQGIVTMLPVPPPAFGLALGGAYRTRLLRLELLGSYVFPRTRSFEQQPRAGGTFQAWSAAARACFVSPWPRAELLFELAGCGGIEAGLVRGSGFGVSPAKVTDRPFSMASASLSITIPLSPMFALRADIDLLLGLLRPSFFVRNLGTAHRVPSLGARGFLGAELRWQ